MLNTIDYKTNKPRFLHLNDQSILTPFNNHLAENIGWVVKDTNTIFKMYNKVFLFKNTMRKKDCQFVRWIIKPCFFNTNTLHTRRADDQLIPSNQLFENLIPHGMGTAMKNCAPGETECPAGCCPGNLKIAPYILSIWRKKIFFVFVLRNILFADLGSIKSWNYFFFKYQRTMA